jgi:hypothetical protein
MKIREKHHDGAAASPSRASKIVENKNPRKRVLVEQDECAGLADQMGQARIKVESGPFLFSFLFSRSAGTPIIT